MFERLCFGITAQDFENSGFGSLLLDNNCYRKLGDQRIIQSEEGALAPYFINPKPIVVDVSFLNRRPSSGVTLTMGFRTPSIEDTAMTGFLFDFENYGPSGYFFFRPNAKKFALRLNTVDKVPQTEYPLEPSTDYHLTYHYRSGQFAIFINGTLLVKSTDSGTVDDKRLTDNLRLFHNPRYGDHHHLSERFYYFYMYDYTVSNLVNESSLNPFFFETGFMSEISEMYPIEDVFGSFKNSFEPERVSDQQVPSINYRTVLEGQYTYNGAYKTRYPSSVYIHLYNPANQTTLASAFPDPDGKFRIYYSGTLSEYTTTQLLTVDILKDFNSISLTM